MSRSIFFASDVDATVDRVIMDSRDHLDMVRFLTAVRDELDKEIRIQHGSRVIETAVCES